MKTVTIKIPMIKEPDLWWEVQEKLQLDDEMSSRYFLGGDYAEIEIEIDESLNIVKGKFIPPEYR